MKGVAERVDSLRVSRKYPLRSLAAVIVLIILLLYAVSLLAPLLWALWSSFRVQIKFSGNIWGLPNKADGFFVNYASIFSSAQILLYMWRSVLLTFVGSLTALISSTMAAYVMARYRFRLRGLIFFLAISVMLIPTTGSMVATYRFFEATGLLYTYLAPILLYSSGFGASFLLLYGFFRALPEDYKEAANIDGASEFRVFVQIMLPLTVGALITVFILNCISIWNDYLTVYLYMPNKPNLSVGLYMMMNDSSANYPQMFACVIVAAVPILILYIALSDKIIKNTALGGIKG